MRRRRKEEGDTGSPAEDGPQRREPPPTSVASTEAPHSSEWTLCSCQTVAVVFGAIAMISFFFGRHLYPLVAEDVAVLKGTEKAEPPPVHEDVMEIFRVFEIIPDGVIDPIEFQQIARYLPRRREVCMLHLLSISLYSCVYCVFLVVMCTVWINGINTV